MKHTKKTLITIETSEMLIFRRATSQQQAWCEACGVQVEMVRPDAVVAVAGVSARAVPPDRGASNSLHGDAGRLVLDLPELAGSDWRM